jgi:hemolysin D
VPVASHLEIEAMVSNCDIGFVHAGQDGEIKVILPIWLLLHGQVLLVPQDAITHDKTQEKSNSKPPQGTESSASKPKGEELVYAARVSLDRRQMQVENKLANLSPGMAVTVEIKTGRAPLLIICSHRCSGTNRRVCERDEKASFGSYFRGRPAPSLLKILKR